MEHYDLAKRIYELRKAKQLSQKELGALVGVSNKAVSKWETGAAIPKTDILLKLAAVFEISPEEFLVETASGSSSFPKHQTLEDVVKHTQTIIQKERASNELFTEMFSFRRSKWYLIILAAVITLAVVYMVVNVSFWVLLLPVSTSSLTIAAMFVVCAGAAFTGVWYTAYVVTRLPLWMKCVCLIGALWLFGFLILGGMLLLLPTTVKAVIVLLKGRGLHE